MFLEPFCNRYEGPDKHARVPSEVPTVDVFHRLFQVRLFHKLLGSKKSCLVRRGSLRSRQRFAHANVAITSGGFRWLDSDCDNSLPPAREVERVREHSLEALRFLDHVVRWENSHDGFCGTGACQSSPQSNGSA